YMADPPDGGSASGHYSTDKVLELASALLRAGKDFGNPDWGTAGQNTIEFVYAHAYNASLDLFPRIMGGVVDGDGTANPCETFASVVEQSGSGTETLNGNTVHAGENGHIALSLLRAYRDVHDPKLLDRATRILDALQSTTNKSGLWDPASQGYFR